MQTTYNFKEVENFLKNDIDIDEFWCLFDVVVSELDYFNYGERLVLRQMFEGKIEGVVLRAAEKGYLTFDENQKIKGIEDRLLVFEEL